ncbi:hypothetical protein AAMO2058_000136300 [Amorphochlora amoebiformis]
MGLSTTQKVRKGSKAESIKSATAKESSEKREEDGLPPTLREKYRNLISEASIRTSESLIPDADHLGIHLSSSTRALLEKTHFGTETALHVPQSASNAALAPSPPRGTSSFSAAPRISSATFDHRSPSRTRRGALGAEQTFSYSAHIPPPSFRQSTEESESQDSKTLPHTNPNSRSHSNPALASNLHVNGMYTCAAPLTSSEAYTFSPARRRLVGYHSPTSDPAVLRTIKSLQLKLESIERRLSNPSTAGINLSFSKNRIFRSSSRESRTEDENVSVGSRLDDTLDLSAWAFLVLLFVVSAVLYVLGQPVFMVANASLVIILSLKYVVA